MERVAFCNTGSEAVTAAIRVARTVSGRDTIAMFAGAYHGVFDEVLVRPTRVDGQLRSMPIAPGIPSNMVENILVLDYGSPEALDDAESARVRARRRPRRAGAEPPPRAAAGRVPPRGARDHREDRDGARLRRGRLGLPRPTRAAPRRCSGSAPTSRRTARSSAAVFRSASSPAAAQYMDALDGGQWSYGDDSFPEVGVTFFAGTFVRHPLALAAAQGGARAADRRRARSCSAHSTCGPRSSWTSSTRRRRRSARRCASRSFASWFCFNFPSDVPYASLFYAYMRDKGIHIWEGRAGFLTTAHTDEDIARVVIAFKETLAEMQAADFLPGRRRAARWREPGAATMPNGREAWFVPDPDARGEVPSGRGDCGNPWLRRARPSPGRLRPVRAGVRSRR